MSFLIKVKVFLVHLFDVSEIGWLQTLETWREGEIHTY